MEQYKHRSTKDSVDVWQELQKIITNLFQLMLDIGNFDNCIEYRVNICQRKDSVDTCPEFTKIINSIVKGVGTR